MKETVFVDTSAWLALINEADADHAKAKAIRFEQAGFNVLIKQR